MRAFVAALIIFYAATAQAVTYDLYKAAVLRGVDKITGQVKEMDVTLNDGVRFGTLYITVRTCQKTPPEEQPEAAAFIEIDEIKADAFGKRWFSGWMFASSAAMSPLEHPVYDIWVVDCKIRLGSPAPATDAPPAAE